MHQTARFFSEGGRDLVEITNVHPDTDTKPTAWVREPTDEDKAAFRGQWQAYEATKAQPAEEAAEPAEEPETSGEPTDG